MGIIEISILLFVCSCLVYAFVANKLKKEIGCAPLVYVFLFFFLVIKLVQYFGSRDPNSLFVRQSLVIATEISFRPSDIDSFMSGSEYKKALLIGKGEWFSESKEIIPLEIIYRDQNKTEQSIGLEFENKQIPFGKESTVRDYDGNKYSLKLKEYVTNSFHENYYPSSSNKQDIEKLRDYYEKKYKSYYIESFDDGYHNRY